VNFGSETKQGARHGSAVDFEIQAASEIFELFGARRAINKR